MFFFIFWAAKFSIIQIKWFEKQIVCVLNSISIAISISILIFNQHFVLWGWSHFFLHPNISKTLTDRCVRVKEREREILRQNTMQYIYIAVQVKTNMLYIWFRNIYVWCHLRKKIWLGFFSILSSFSTYHINEQNIFIVYYISKMCSTILFLIKVPTFFIVHI